MATVKLKFQSIEDLWQFKREIAINTIGVDTANLTLICPCSEEEIKDAAGKYNAVIVSKDPPQDPFS